jgi:aarF domain-containing kinase
MSGKRLLDVACLFNASRSVVRKHVALRSRQLDVCTTAVKNQTDRVAQAAKAAAALAHQGRTAGTTVPGHEIKKGMEQDPFHEPPETSTVADDVRQGDLKARQERADRSPLPDGTIPAFEINVPNQDKDVFYDGRSQEKPLSQQDAATTTGGEELEPEPSSTSTIPDPLSPEKTLPNQIPDLEGVNTEVFRSPRVAKILMGKAQGKEKSGSLMSEVVNGTSMGSHNTLHVQQENGQRVSMQKERATPIQQTDKPATEGDIDTQELAADIVEDTLNTDVCRISPMTLLMDADDILTSGGTEKLEVSNGIFVPKCQLSDA